MGEPLDTLLRRRNLENTVRHWPLREGHFCQYERKEGRANANVVGVTGTFLLCWKLRVFHFLVSL